MPQTLAEIAEKLEADARRLHAEGNHDAAVELYKAAADTRKAIEALLRLPDGDHSGNVRKMVTAERVRHSKGQGDVDPLVAAANAHHYTLRSLAEKLGCTHSLLSQARKGGRSIDKTIADAIEKLTGFPATRGNWPKLKG